MIVCKIWEAAASKRIPSKSVYVVIGREDNVGVFCLFYIDFWEWKTGGEAVKQAPRGSYLQMYADEAS